MPPKSSQNSWRGRSGHAGNTQAWLGQIKTQCESWPIDSLSDRALVSLLDALPTLARRNEATFQASVRLLETQSSEQAWTRALKHRLVVVQRAADGGGGRALAGDAFILAPRKDSWRATRDDAGQWAMHDGRTLQKFLGAGSPGRREAWQAASELHGLTLMELPTKHLEGEVWAGAFVAANKWLNSDHPTISKARKNGETWKLALRRIRGVGLRGLFDPIGNTVIVDPRNPDTLLHELAHWVLGHKAGMDARQAEKEAEDLLQQSQPQPLNGGLYGF